MLEKNATLDPIAQQSGGTVRAALVSLMLGTFALGMTEYVIMGLLTNVAADLNTSIASAGQLITGYALGVAIGGPIVTLLTLRMKRKELLIALLVIFIAGNMMAALAQNYPLLMIARIITSLAHGTFFGVGAVIAAGLVSPDKRAGAISIMYTGLTLATVMGVPIGTFIGQRFGWHSTFWVVAILGIAAFAGIIAFVPRIPYDRNISAFKELRFLMNSQVLLAFTMTVFGFGGVFTAFTYIAPMLEEITGFGEHNVSYILVLFGIGVTLGNIIGGKLADWKLMQTLFIGLGLLIATLILFYFSIENKTAAVIAIFLWGTASFIIVPALQIRIMNMAKNAQTMASTINQSAFNLGNAGGAIAGGLAIDRVGLAQLPLIAALVTVLGLALTLFSYFSEKRSGGVQSD